MFVIIKVLKGEESRIEVTESTTVIELKENIETILSIPILHQKIIHLGKTLADDKTIGFYTTIKDGTKLTLVVKKPDPLNEIIFRHFKKYYTESQAENLTKEFMIDFEAKIKNYSLDDLERLATNCMSQENRP